MIAPSPSQPDHSGSPVLYPFSTADHAAPVGRVPCALLEACCQAGTDDALVGNMLAPISPAAMIEQIVARVNEAALQGTPVVRVRMDMPECDLILADEAHLNQVLQGMIEHAMHTATNGCLTINACLMDDPEHERGTLQIDVHYTARASGVNALTGLVQSLCAASCSVSRSDTEEAQSLTFEGCLGGTDSEAVEPACGTGALSSASFEGSLTITCSSSGQVHLSLLVDAERMM